MTVSVIVPAYNREAFLGEALESLAAQKEAGDLEVIVVDDGSADGTGERVREFREAHPELPVHYIFQEHAGISAARNRGILEAKGDWIAFLDSDDLWHPEKLKKQRAYLEEHPCCRIVFTRYENFADLPEGGPGEGEKRILESEDPWYLACALAEKRLFEEGGLFSMELTVGEDDEWVLRNKILGVDISHRVEETLYFRRVHGGNISLGHRSDEKKRIGSFIALAVRNADRIRRKKK